MDDAVEHGCAKTREAWDRIFSGWSENKAEEFATKVANYAFDSMDSGTQLTQLSLAIADDLVR